MLRGEIVLGEREAPYLVDLSAGCELNALLE